jgi:hypothetical protein
MTNQDYIISIYRYYSKFVPKAVLSKLFKQPNISRNAGYSELVAEIMAQPDTHVVPEIGTFIVSANDKYVKDTVKNSTGIVLFVEYGQFSFNPIATNGVKEGISINVAREYNIADNDNLNEALLMNECDNIINGILMQMRADQEELESCGLNNMITFPADIFPIDPSKFNDRSGWSASFNNENSVL